MKLPLLLMFCLLGSALSQEFVSNSSVLKTSDTSEQVQTNCTCRDETMDCSSRGTTTFSRNERCARNVSRIDLSQNRIVTLPEDAFALLTGLKELFLQNNNITELSEEIFSDLRNLRILMLSENNLMSVPEGVFSALNNLEGISLYGNKLQTLPNHLFAGLRSLNIVSLSDNQLSTLPTDTFSGLTSMELIDLARNRLTNVPCGLFQGIQSIRFLDLSGNQLTHLSSEDLNGIRNIYRLDLMDNKITSIPQYDAKWPQVKLSYWAGNRIERVSEEVVRSWLIDGEDRVLSLQGYDPSSTTLFQPQDLQWAVSDDRIRTEVSGRGCRCGTLKLEKARVVLCVNVECGPGHVHADWVAALRASSAGGRRPPPSGS